MAIATHAVAPPELEDSIADELRERDVITTREYLDFDPHVIYFEGGLTRGFGGWRVPETLLEQSIRGGAVAVVADVGFNELLHEREDYLAAWDFLRVRPRYGAEASHPLYELNPKSPVYGIDRQSQRREFSVSPDQMIVADWLRPVYDGVRRIEAWSPMDLLSVQNVLASGNGSTSATLCDDLFVDERAACPFAGVRSIGEGYIAFIAAYVSLDQVLESCPDNARWLVNLVQHLRREIAADAARYSGLRELQRSIRELKQSLASQHIDPGDVDESCSEFNIVNHVLDSPMEAAVRRAAKDAARSQLEVIFGPAWDRVGEPAKRFVIQAEVHRRDSELLADAGEEQDFSAAICAYSKALEAELSSRLFEPFRTWPDAHDLPRVADKSQAQSVEALRKFVDGRKLTLGQMAFVLMNVGCRLRNEEANAFSAYLQRHLTDYTGFCDDVKFPQLLDRYANEYRNKAMHTDEISSAQCIEARRFLLEEPNRLLAYLAEIVRDPS